MDAAQTPCKNRYTVGKHVFLCFLCNMRTRHTADVALHANRKPLVGNRPCCQQNKINWFTLNQTESRLTNQFACRLSAGLGHVWRFWIARHWLKTSSDNRNEVIGDSRGGGGRGASVFRCSCLEELFWLAGWAAERLYLPPSLIKTNDSRCCSATGKTERPARQAGGRAGRRRVCVGGSPSLPPPSILLRTAVEPATESTPFFTKQCKKRWNKAADERGGKINSERNSQVI